jgi:hypothetical protein
LSISGEAGFHLRGFSPVVVRRVLEMLGSRGVSVNEIGPVLWHRVTHYTLCPLG